MDIPMYREEKREYQFEQIQNRIRENGGLFRTKDAKELGIDYRRLQRFVNEGRLRKVKSGYYTDDKCITEERLVAALFPDGVLTMESALYEYGYLKHRPKIWRIAIDKNTSKGRFNLEYPWVTPFYTEENTLKDGVDEIELAGNTIHIYKKERLICDILKYQDKMDRKDFRRAIFSFVDDENKDMGLLMEYAEKRKVRRKVHDMIGIWLD
ncbi:MAG: type IV toxin-antitoxin system AbiEi family antitoxin domain-containing protein [Lachnospiraceae bacterium]|nr:type IV toxin-antitoxin system AbiEi family antitoxin domain-containing protein [Lachnospiraceae bacterium]